MHELSVAASILENTVECAEGCKKIKKIYLYVGCLLMLNAEQLKFGFEILSKGTSAENAELEIEIGKAKLLCENGHETSVELKNLDARNVFLLSKCSVCGAGTEILGGRELVLKKIIAE